MKKEDYISIVFVTIVMGLIFFAIGSIFVSIVNIDNRSRARCQEYGKEWSYKHVNSAKACINDNGDIKYLK